VTDPCLATPQALGSRLSSGEVAPFDASPGCDGAASI
jgi:hypothetical protein